MAHQENVFAFIIYLVWKVTVFIIVASKDNKHDLGLNEGGTKANAYSSIS